MKNISFLLYLFLFLLQNCNFILATAGLILLMPLSLALFYGGMVRSKNIKVLHTTLGMRLTQENEIQGMDYTEHSETAYN
ncbi:ammonium transporter [Desulfobulbus sp. TB]|nr:ammonium transporter [Desulfobulbus sp. TB]